MAARRKPRRGLACSILKLLRDEGRADTAYIAKKLGYTRDTIHRVANKLYSRKLIGDSPHGGGHYVTDKGWSAANRCRT